MTRWIGIFQRSIKRISISIPRGWDARRWNDRIRGHESPQRVVIPASPEKVQSQPALDALPGESEAGRGAAGGVAVLAPGFVAHFGGLGAGAVGADHERIPTRNLHLHRIVLKPMKWTR